ncbi:MAG: cupin domain-containing protein [Pseudonocardiaceae bacterium]|nr:cupin domain-containing protein [Pseudonocardiaceae bacterium]
MDRPRLPNGRNALTRLCREGHLTGNQRPQCAPRPHLGTRKCLHVGVSRHPHASPLTARRRHLAVPRGAGGDGGARREMNTFSELDAMATKRIWDGVTARIVQSELITMAIVELEPNSVVARHQHENEQLGFVIEGSIHFTVDGVSRECGPGDTWRILANVPHHAEAGRDGAVVAEVYSPVRADWAQLPDSAAQSTRWPSRS